MDRDSYGQHVRRQQVEDPRHSINDDPFSHDDSGSGVYSETDTSAGRGYSHSTSVEEEEDKEEDDALDNEDETSGDRTFRTRFSTGSWIRGTLSALAKRSKMISAMKKTLK
jgi:hypothetical protein